MYSSRTLLNPASGAGESVSALLLRTRSLPTTGCPVRPRALRRSMRRCRAISFFSRAVGPRRIRCAGIDFRFGAVRAVDGGGGTRASVVGSLSAGGGEVASLLRPLSRELATPVDDPDEDHEAGELSRDRVRGCSFSLSFSSNSPTFDDDKSSTAEGSLDDGGGSTDDEDASELERGRERSSRCFGGRSEEDGGGDDAPVDGGDEGEAERGEGGMTGMTG